MKLPALTIYIRHDFGHVKSRRQTSFSSCIQSYCSLVPRSSNGFCRCFAFQIGKICYHHCIIRHFQFRKCLPVKVTIQILLFWESSPIHNAEFAVDLSPVPNAHSPFFSGFESCQIQGFQERCITWKYASLTVELTVGRIQTFNYIGHVNNLSDIR